MPYYLLSSITLIGYNHVGISFKLYYVFFSIKMSDISHEKGHSAQDIIHNSSFIYSIIFLSKKNLTAPVLAGKTYISLICCLLVPMRIFAPCKRSVN